jgi:cysteine desulfurase / selenocysteine lyase
VGADESVPPRRLSLALLRPLAKPRLELVLDGDLRQPCEDARLPAAPCATREGSTLTVAESPLSKEFGPFDGRTWLNCAHQGPLPHAARAEAEAAIAAKVNPWGLDGESFVAVPARLRALLARVVNASPDDVLLANSTSYTLNLVAQGLTWREGDEVICVDGDFPATVLPWMTLARRGVKVALLRARGARVDADLLAEAIGPRTRVVCMSWVFSFFGHAVDLDSLGAVCRDRGVRFVVNASQAVGVRALDVQATPIDGVACCGWKWLCGPYGTGFGWLSESLRAELDYPQPHWLRHRKSSRAEPAIDYTLADDGTAAHLDVFANANFFNFRPLAAAVDHLLAVGLERIARHDQALVARLLDNLDGTSYEVLSPRTEPHRSTLVFLSHRQRSRNGEIVDALRRARIDIALREGRLRVSPHLHNSIGDIDRLVDALEAVATSS